MFSLYLILDVANQTRLIKLQLQDIKLQKRAARIILKADFMTPFEELFKELNWLSFPERVQFHIYLMVYKRMTGQAPEYIASMLMYVANHHERQTRWTTHNKLYVPRSHSTDFDREF